MSYNNDYEFLLMLTIEELRRHICEIMEEINAPENIDYSRSLFGDKFAALDSAFKQLEVLKKERNKTYSKTENDWKDCRYISKHHSITRKRK